jgi:hypothetical protein
MKNMLGHSCWVGWLAAAVLAASPVMAADAVEHFLAARDSAVSISDLEKSAGGEEQLVKRLVELRSNTATPFVGVRATKLLFYYSGRSDVSGVLLSDARSSSHQGVIHLLAQHIDRIQDVDARRSIAQELVRRAATEESLRPHVKLLRASGDKKVLELSAGLAD